MPGKAKGSETLPRIGSIARPRLPVIIPTIPVFDLELAQVEAGLGLVQGQDVEGHEVVGLALELVAARGPDVDAAFVAEVLVHVLGTHLVVLDLRGGLGREERKV